MCINHSEWRCSGSEQRNDGQGVQSSELRKQSFLTRAFKEGCWLQRGEPTEQKMVQTSTSLRQHVSARLHEGDRRNSITMSLCSGLGLGYCRKCPQPFASRSEENSMSPYLKGNRYMQTITIRCTPRAKQGPLCPSRSERSLRLIRNAQKECQALGVDGQKPTSSIDRPYSSQHQIPSIDEDFR